MLLQNKWNHHICEWTFIICFSAFNAVIASKEDTTVNLNIFHCFILLRFGLTIANLIVLRKSYFLLIYYQSYFCVIWCVTDTLLFQRGKVGLLKWPNLVSYPAGTKWESFQSVWEASATKPHQLSMLRLCQLWIGAFSAIAGSLLFGKQEEKFGVTSNTC